MPTRTHHPGKDLPVTPILALIGAAILAATGVFTYFGSYWYQYWRQIRQTVKQPPRKHWMDADDE